MPGTLSSPAVAALRGKLERLLEHEQEAFRLRETMAKAQKELLPHDEAIANLRREIPKDLREMDVDTPLNHGWEGRVTWFLKELYEQSLKHARSSP